MKPTRRTFLGMIAAAPVAARTLPLGPAEGAAAQGAGVLMRNAWDTGPEASPHPHVSGRGQLSGRNLVAFLRQGMPPFKEYELRSRARQSRLLDPDLAAMRSLSVTAALRIQWERNYQHIKEDWLGSYLRDEQRDEWIEKFNIPWL
jgi:hypothetical protein